MDWIPSAVVSILVVALGGLGWLIRGARDSSRVDSIDRALSLSTNMDLDHDRRQRARDIAQLRFDNWASSQPQDTWSWKGDRALWVGVISAFIAIIASYLSGLLADLDAVWAGQQVRAALNAIPIAGVVGIIASATVVAVSSVQLGRHRNARRLNRILSWVAGVVWMLGGLLVAAMAFALWLANVAP